MEQRHNPQHPGRSLLCVAVLALLALAGAQWGGFTQPTLTGSDRLMTQYEALCATVAHEGPLELVVLGDSIARQSVDTLQLQTRVQEELERPVPSFNFGAGGTTPEVLPLAIELAYGVDRPPVALVVVTPRMVSAWDAGNERATRLVRESPYGRALSDPVRWRGALVRRLLDDVAAFGLRLRLKGALLGEPPVERRVGGYDASRGHSSTPDFGRAALEGQLEREKRLDWSYGEELTALLAANVRRLQAHGARVVLVEAVSHPEAIAQRRELSIEPRVPDAIRRVCAETGARALLLPEGFELAPAEFSDLLHPNAAGATRYTAWLAEALSAELAGDTQSDSNAR